MPNTDGHIHLEKQLKSGIWEEYAGDFEFRGRSTCHIQHFANYGVSAFHTSKYDPISKFQVRYVRIVCQLFNVSAVCYLFCREMLYVSRLGFLEKQVS